MSSRPASGSPLHALMSSMGPSMKGFHLLLSRGPRSSPSCSSPSCSSLMSSPPEPSVPDSPPAPSQPASQTEPSVPSVEPDSIVDEELDSLEPMNSDSSSSDSSASSSDSSASSSDSSVSRHHHYYIPIKNDVDEYQDMLFRYCIHCWDDNEKTKKPLCKPAREYWKLLKDHHMDQCSISFLFLILELSRCRTCYAMFRRVYPIQRGRPARGTVPSSRQPPFPTHLPSFPDWKPMLYMEQSSYLFSEKWKRYVDLIMEHSQTFVLFIQGRTVILPQNGFVAQVSTTTSSLSNLVPTEPLSSLSTLSSSSLSTLSSSVAFDIDSWVPSLDLEMDLPPPPLMTSSSSSSSTLSTRSSNLMSLTSLYLPMMDPSNMDNESPLFHYPDYDPSLSIDLME